MQIYFCKKEFKRKKVAIRLKRSMLYRVSKGRSISLAFGSNDAFCTNLRIL